MKLTDSVSENHKAFSCVYFKYMKILLANESAVQ